MEMTLEKMVVKDLAVDGAGVFIGVTNSARPFGKIIMALTLRSALPSINLTKKRRYKFFDRVERPARSWASVSPAMVRQSN